MPFNGHVQSLVSISNDTIDLITSLVFDGNLKKKRTYIMVKTVRDIDDVFCSEYREYPDVVQVVCVCK